MMRPLPRAYRTPKGGRLGKRAAKAHSGTVREFPMDANVRVRTVPSRVKVIESRPREFDRIRERGMIVPS